MNNDQVYQDGARRTAEKEKPAEFREETSTTKSSQSSASSALPKTMSLQDAAVDSECNSNSGSLNGTAHATTDVLEGVGGRHDDDESNNLNSCNRTSACRDDENDEDGTSRPATPPNTVRPTPKDILFGRGKPFQNHPANRNMLQLIDQYKVQYNESPRDRKRPIVEQIMATLTQDGGRFLRRHSEDTSSPFWVEVTKEIAFDKVSHAFRSRSKPKSSRNKSDNNGNSESDSISKTTVDNGFGISNVNVPENPAGGAFPHHFSHHPYYGAMFPPTVPIPTSTPAVAGYGMAGGVGTTVGPFNPWLMSMVTSPAAFSAAHAGSSNGNGDEGRGLYPAASGGMIILPPGMPPYPNAPGFTPTQPPFFHYLQQSAPPMAPQIHQQPFGTVLPMMQSPEGRRVEGGTEEQKQQDV